MLGLPVLAKTYRQSRRRGTSGMAPGSDIPAAMSGFDHIASGMPPGPDETDSPSLRGLLTHSGSRGSPNVTLYTRGFSHFVTSVTDPVASGWSGGRVGLAPTGKRRLTTAHTHIGHCWRCTWAGYLHLYACLSVALEPVVTVLGLRTHADVGISNFNGVPI